MIIPLAIPSLRENERFRNVKYKQVSILPGYIMVVPCGYTAIASQESTAPAQQHLLAACQRADWWVPGRVGGKGQDASIF